MSKQLMKGNEAIVKSAILAGCRAFYGYPITPASEITEAAAEHMPSAGGVFLQAESEVAAINMLYGAASAGVRCMTASSGPGISLMQEGISYMAGAQLPCVIADITRGGPGLGNIAAEQSDYHQVVKGGGHGNYRTIVLAPHSVQEMADLTALAFELADRYRNPVVLLADGFIGQMMEPVEFSETLVEPRQPAWAVAGTAATRGNLITSLFMDIDDLEAHNRNLEQKYQCAEQLEARAEEWQTDDAEIVLVGYGIVGRILKAVTAEARADGIKVGVLRPITLYPFPKSSFQRIAERAQVFVVVEMSNGQLVEDVRLALNGVRPVEFLGRTGGNVPSHEEVLALVHSLGVSRAQPGRQQSSMRSRWQMSSEMVSDYTVVRGKARSFYDRYERKPELQHQTHFCPGCGHGVVHKMLARAIDELGIQDRTILVGPVGCSVFTYYYFDVGNVQAAHGRAPAVATAMKRSRPESIVIGYQGDGDLSAIGAAEILHAANRGENITVIFVNNAIYSMTGGQAAPTTLIGQKSTTTPNGRSTTGEGYPMHVSELLSTLQGPVYIERVGLGDNKQIAQANRAVRRAVENQVKGLGFSLIEVLAPCPTIWKMSAVDAQHWVRDVMEKTYPLGVFCDRTKDAHPRSLPEAMPPLHEIPERIGIAGDGLSERRIASSAPVPVIDLHVRVAGFGGQGVLLLGEVLAQAGLDAGLEVSWLPSYGPEMRSGTSNCHVRLSNQTIDSPLVSSPGILVAMNEPSLRKFDKSVRPGGWVIYNGEKFPEDCVRDDVRVLAAPFTHIADELGDPRVCNMVMLGALLEIAKPLPQASIDEALRLLVKNMRWLALDERALARGRELFRELCQEA